MKLYNLDCLNWLKEREDNSIHLFLTDPPYQLSDTKHFKQRHDLEDYDKSENSKKYGNKANPFAGKTVKGFMGKEWDVLPTKEILSEIHRVLKPGGFLVAFSSPRTYHRLAYESEGVGFQIHPMISYIFGSGFPKAVDCEKTIFRTTGNKKLAEKFKGMKYGMHALKPSCEPIGIFQKETETQNQIDNILKNGTGVYAIDKTKIEISKADKENIKEKSSKENTQGYIHHACAMTGGINMKFVDNTDKGRFPSNTIIDENSAQIMDKQSGESLSSGGRIGNKDGSYNNLGKTGFTKEYQKGDPGFGDTGGASRFFKQCNYSKNDFESFFYTSKASVTERNLGCDNLPEKQIKEDGGVSEFFG